MLVDKGPFRVPYFYATCGGTRTHNLFFVRERLYPIELHRQPAEDKGELIGFCWTKIHGAHTHSHNGEDDDHGHDALGEIYVLAVNPDYKGQGVGRDLTITGLNYLKYQGLNNVMLYVGVENKPAFNLYKSLGFVESGKDVMYKLKL